MMPTSLQSVYASDRASYLYYAKLWNDTLRFNWQAYFEHTFLVELQNCTIPASSQPTPPPPSWVVIESPDLKPDLSNVTSADVEALSWSQTGPPVCEIPPFAPPKVLPSGSAAIAANPGVAGTLPVPAGDIMPIGFEITDPTTGARYRKTASPTPFGFAVWYQKIAAALILAFALLFAPRPARAQVAIACSPQPIVSMSSLGKAVMGEWACFVTNAGPARTVGVEEFYSAVLQIHPISPNVALQILTDRQARTVPAKIVTAIDKIAKPLGPPVGAVLTMVSRSNAVTGVIIAAASQSFGMLADPLVGIAQGQVPSITSYTADLMQAPLQLPPGGGATKVIYCAKQKNPAPIAVKLQ